MLPIDLKLDLLNDFILFILYLRYISIFQRCRQTTSGFKVHHRSQPFSNFENGSLCKEKVKIHGSRCRLEILTFANRILLTNTRQRKRDRQKERRCCARADGGILFSVFGLGAADEAGRFFEPPQRRADPAETEKRYSR